MANQTINEALARVGRENRQYQRNEARWRFLLESYQGGDEYRRAGHLVRYVLETAAEYQQRLANTPLDNQCRSIIATYISFLFRTAAEREWGSWAADQDPVIQDLLADADLEGRGWDSFWKDAATWAAVFGHAWILVTKPNVDAGTRADELEWGVRPYLNLLTPLAVVDWQWERDMTGRYELTYFKYVEEFVDDITVYREWRPDHIVTTHVNLQRGEIQEEYTEINGLGRIPAVILYHQRSQVRGIGLSAIGDIADMQRAIYNELSEVEQSIRLEGHPSIVVTPDVKMGAGAGALIQIPENLDPGLRPYVLTTDAAPVDMIYKSIEARRRMIDTMANTGTVRATETVIQSGVAREMEFQLLNARLSEIADNIELAEEQVWTTIAEYQGRTWEGMVLYPESFSITDRSNVLAELESARRAATDPDVLAAIDVRILELLEIEVQEDIVPQDRTAADLVATQRQYPDGEPIDARLPEAYGPATSAEQCSNCAAYDDERMWCDVWNAPVRPDWWCARWIPIEVEGE